MLLTLILAWLGLSCVGTFLAGHFWPDYYTRVMNKIGIGDEDSQQAIMRVALPLTMLLSIPIGFANYLNLSGNQHAAVTYVLFAGTLLAGFFALAFLASWSLGWKCITLGFGSVILALSTPLFAAATYFQWRGDESLAQQLWAPATVASVGAMLLRAAAQAKDSVSSKLKRRPKSKRRGRKRKR